MAKTYSEGFNFIYGIVKQKRSLVDLRDVVQKSYF